MTSSVMTSYSDKFYKQVFQNDWHVVLYQPTEFRKQTININKVIKNLTKNPNLVETFGGGGLAPMCYLDDTNRIQKKFLPWSRALEGQLLPTSHPSEDARMVRRQQNRAAQDSAVGRKILEM